MPKKIALISGISRSAVRSSASLAFVVGATAVFLTAAGSALWHQPGACKILDRKDLRLKYGFDTWEPKQI